MFFFLSFAAKAQVYGHGEGEKVAYVFTNAIWGGKSLEMYLNGKLLATNPIQEKPYILPIIGLILLIVAVVGAVLVSFLVKNNKLSKIILIVAGVLAIVGGVFVFFVGESAMRSLVYYIAGNKGLEQLESVRAEMQASGFKDGPRALAIIIGIVAILAGGSFAAAPFLPEKKLIK